MYQLHCCGYYAPARRGGGSKRCFCLSISPSRTWRIIRESKGLACPNLEGRFPTLDATCTPVSRSRSRSPGPLMLTHIVRHIFRTPRPTNFKLGIQKEDDDLHHCRRHDLQGERSRSQSHVITLSRVTTMAHKSKTNSRSITKIGRRVPRDTCYIAH